MSTEQIFNFIKINDHIATGGQPTEAQLAAAREEGYTAVINLAPVGTADPRLPSLTDEAATVSALGLHYTYIPVDWANPRLEDFAAFSDAMDELRGQKLLIHCAANYRVTAFFSLYAMKKLGWEKEQADALLARIWEADPRYVMDDKWRSFIDKVRSL